jgi:hypothetical protein
MTIRGVASVSIDEASEKRLTRKGEFLSELNEAKGEGLVVGWSGEVESRADANKAEALDNNANNLSQGVFHNARAARYAARYKLWKLSGLNRVRDCGRVSVVDFPGIKLKDGSASYSGLATCGSVWCCPVCNSKIMTQRANEVRTAIDAWKDKGKVFAFQTLTMRHHKGQSLDELWSALSFAWQRLNSGASSMKEAALYGQVGFIRVVEVTYGSNGWHVHIHIVRFLNRKLTESERKAWAESQFKRWGKALMDKGLAEPLRAAQDLKLTKNAEDLAKYITKQSNFGRRLSMEITSQRTKRARLGGRKPFDILADYIANPDGPDKSLWLEYEKAATGKKQNHWSKGLRELLGIDRLETDEDKPKDEALTDSQRIDLLPDIVLNNESIAKLNSTNGWQHEALYRAEVLGLDGLREFLDSIGVNHMTPERAFGEKNSIDDYLQLQSVLHKHRQH